MLLGLWRVLKLLGNVIGTRGADEDGGDLGAVRERARWIAAEGGVKWEVVGE